ncbi:elongation factor 1-alpha C-terminal domain-related protein, partial [Streptomyces sp. MS06]|uniref:elongation factor 1-alpha C-terminal domain-related protein n=1 Tax=Streptomyces sp. MS06 TaxID=3385974 RepID=UPI0039A3066F
GGDPAGAPVRFPVQYVIRHGEDRHYAGRLVSGTLGVGDRVIVHPSGQTSRVAGLTVLGTEAASVRAPQSIGVLLADERDVSRGDMITTGVDAPVLTQDVRADVCHLADRPLRIGDRVLLKHTTRTVRAIVRDLDGGSELTVNGLGRIVLRTAEPLALDDYAVSRDTGAFILLDPADGTTLTAGMVRLGHRE